MPRTRVKPPIQSDPSDNRNAIADAVVEWMHSHHRDISIDTLLARPCDALQMGIAISASLGLLKNPGRAKAIAADAARYREQTPDDVAAIHRVLRVALNERKHGDLRKDRY